MSRIVVMTAPELKRRNARLGWILASVALILALGFVAKVAWLGL